MHDNTKLYAKTHQLSNFSSIQLMSDTNYHSSRSSVTKQGKQSFQFLSVVVVSSSRCGSGSNPDPTVSDIAGCGMDPDPAR